MIFAADFDEPFEERFATTGRAVADDDSSEPNTAASAGSLPPEEMPRYSEVEMRDLVAVARATGIDIGRREADASHAAKTALTVEQLADTLGAMRRDAREAVETECARIAAVGFGLLAGMLPCIFEHLAAEQLRHSLGDIFRGLLDENEVVVTVHPDLATIAGEQLHAMDGVERDGTVRLLTSASLSRGDLRVRWRNGHAARDTAGLQRFVVERLAAAGLLAPADPIKENVHVN